MDQKMEALESIIGQLRLGVNLSKSIESDLVCVPVEDIEEALVYLKDYLAVYKVIKGVFGVEQK